MVYALVLSGGKGIRLGNDRPKQYIEVRNKPIIGYSLDTFQMNQEVDGIVIVADEIWRDYIGSYIKDNNISKFTMFAPSGISRTHSILNGMLAMEQNNIDLNSIIIVHDAARPNISNGLINSCIKEIEDCDCTMPVLPVKDTVYMSEDAKSISSLLNRNHLWAGQAPESVRLGLYLDLIRNMSDEELSSISGTSAVVFEKGLNVRLFPGDEHNYKITTFADLEKFKQEIEG